MTTDFAELDLFFGEANPAEARVYARLRWNPVDSRNVRGGLPPVHLSGLLLGPHCMEAHTLPATTKFADLGPGEFLLAQAIVPDPCFWTPELPFLYRATIEVRRGSDVVGVIERDFGIRPLAVSGRRFYYEGKPWVLRGVHRPRASSADLRECRAADAALCVDNPTDELCAASSQQGVLIVANLTGDVAFSVDNIRRLARHAAVGFILLDGDAPDTDFHALAPNIIFVRPIDQHAQTSPNLAQAVLCPIERMSDLPLPLISYRPAEAGLTIHQQRACCDHLQRDLADRYEAAGFLV